MIFVFVSFKVLFYFLTRFNSTLRKITEAREPLKNGKIKKIGDIKYIRDDNYGTLLGRIYLNNKLDLEKGGMYTENNLTFFILFKWVFVPIFSILTIVSNVLADSGFYDSLIYGVMALVILNGLIYAIIHYHISKEANKFKLTSYKLFKFLRNQLSAGVKMTTAVNNLPSIVNDKLLKNRLILMASHFASKSDIDEALSYITDHYQTIEAKTLALSIKQSIETGQSDNSFKQKEKKLFNMYLNVIKKKTQILMLKYFVIGLLYGFVIVLIIGYPQWLDFIEANRILFGN